MIENILDSVGNTPLIRLNNLVNSGDAEVLLKYERTNPGGSVKDRAAKYMIDRAEACGFLRPGGTIIESSSGNFGISLSMIGAARGYRVLILVDPKTTENNLALLKAFGAEVIVVTEKDDCGSYHKTRIALANKLAAEIGNSFRPDQCFNLLNSEAHYSTTAREIMTECDGNVDMMIAPVSTGGQLGGISKYIKRFFPEVTVVGVDAEGSVAFGGEPHSYKMPGIGLGWTPENLDLSNVDILYKIRDEDAYMTARMTARHEGILVGPSSGACLLIALKYARKAMGRRVVSMVADGGDRYIQTLFNEDWMKENGFSISTDVSEIRRRAEAVRPWSCSPREVCNYHPELLDGLSVPESTQKINDEIKKRKKEQGFAADFDQRA